jgi:UDP-N-acetylglucosamine--N-acetylmuramyl-(pentapeptide) pyrophosphoryl-undecaprenol N-acetylglucosamine transferase
MRVIVTGGGTGGHVYPALEVARVAANSGAEILYLGSLRGMEWKACMSRGITFHGFASEPVYNYKSISGIRTLAKLMLLSNDAKKKLIAAQADIVFSTGGYSSAPVMAGAKRAGIPLVIHTCDTVPGRSLRMFGGYASAVTSSFHGTKKFFDGKVVRTGHPIREELRSSLRANHGGENLLVVLGGSQGSQFLNESVPVAAGLIPNLKVLHSAGPKQFQVTAELAKSLGARYVVKPYLEADELSEIYSSASLAIGRSGAGISEFAMARMPSILVPLPSSADDHQFVNAQEFEGIGGASVFTQNIRENANQATPENLAVAINFWLENNTGRQSAKEALGAWDVPDATEQIWQQIKNVLNRAR